jgi:hypothetical protein
MTIGLAVANSRHFYRLVISYWLLVRLPRAPLFHPPEGGIVKGLYPHLLLPGVGAVGIVNRR